VIDLVDLLDWKRRVFELYAVVRAATDAEVAWRVWRDVRDDLFRTHLQSPLPEAARTSFTGLEYFPYDPALRLTAELVPDPDEPRAIRGSAGSTTMFHRFARATFELAGRPHSLELYWLEGYGGGLFLPFGDTTSGHETYGGGRYLLDTVKGSDLGGDGGQLVLDFNFAYNPSCSYDPRWACPLTPPANRLEVAVRAGEKAPTN
jgi:uncharacterized protein (DUF1684 family)